MTKVTQYQKEWCLSILDKLYLKPTSRPFQTPLVNDEGIISQNNVIQQPMDLETVRNKVTKDKYQTIKDFSDDVRLIWYNAQSYYPQDHPLTLMAADLSTWFEGKLKNYPVTAEDKWLMKLHKAQQKLNDLIENPIPPKPVIDYPKTQQPEKPKSENTEKKEESQK